jgi:DNA-binding HxlR family transcriptional regulator
MARERADDSKTNWAVEASLGLIGGRFRGVALDWLLKGTHRIGALRRRSPKLQAAHARGAAA